MMFVVTTLGARTEPAMLIPSELPPLLPLMMLPGPIVFANELPLISTP